uniref:class I SAM-dependent methyltransferase n=1 Tax=Mariniflexile sp. TaxID=1979402 RepID=UPI0040476A4D
MASKDIHGKAILDYLRGNEKAELILHNNYGDPESMSVSVFFRDELDLTVLEHLALIECHGKVLDVGAGAGALSLILQERGYDVSGLENSKGCLQAMRELGLQNIIEEDFLSHSKKYDTLLIQMNGMGLAGSLRQVPAFIEKCVSMLNPGGQILMDSSDISYLYEDGTVKPKGYYGEVQYQYEYLGEKSDWFNWVYVDQETLAQIVNDLGLSLEILHIDENDQYLALVRD